MIIESLRLFYHLRCFRCVVCHVQLGNGSTGTDVRVRNNKLHCQNCYSNDEGTCVLIKYLSTKVPKTQRSIFKSGLFYFFKEYFFVEICYIILKIAIFGTMCIL